MAVAFLFQVLSETKGAMTVRMADGTVAEQQQPEEDGSTVDGQQETQKAIVEHAASESEVLCQYCAPCAHVLQSMMVLGSQFKKFCCPMFQLVITSGAHFIAEQIAVSLYSFFFYL